MQKALENPLISVNFKTGAAALIYATGGSKMTLKEASGVVELIREKIQPNAEIIWGTKVDHELGDLLRITVVISGVESEQIISNHKGDSGSQGLSTNVLLGSDKSNIQTQHQKENWLRKDSMTTLRDLRKRLQESKEKTAPQKQKSQSEKEETSEFWDELGLSKGLD